MLVASRQEGVDQVEPLIIGATLTAATGLIGIAWTARHASRTERRRDRIALTREAAVPLRDSLARLDAILASIPTGLVHSRAVGEEMANWGRTFDRYRSRLPQDAQHIDRGVSAALGESLGAIGLSHRHPEAADEPLSPHDDEWHENARSYLSYLISWIDGWHDQPLVRRKPPLQFDPWLKLRRARMDAINSGLFTRTDRLLHRLFGA